MERPSLEQIKAWGAEGAAKRESNRAQRKALPWETRQLERVREHVARLDSDLESATTAVDKLRLTQALSKLYEVAGLPKAGAFRPEPKRAKTTTEQPLE